MPNSYGTESRASTAATPSASRNGSLSLLLRRPAPAASGRSCSGPMGEGSGEYKGYALYTYVHDKSPGEVNGNDIYDLVDGEAPARYTAVEAGGSTGAALFWHVATP